MDKKITGIQVCIWDFDGTLFAPNTGFNQDILEADYMVVMHHTGWSHEKTAAEFAKIFKVKTPSSTETAAILARIPVAEAALECEHYKDRAKYLKKDPLLQSMFQNLSMFQHYILANGIQSKIKPSLTLLGVPNATFIEIVTSEVVGYNKPNLAGFQYILHKTGLPAYSHLMIGDREAVDLAPAKSLGMKTCLVWSKMQSDVADITLKEVYDIVQALI
jgi:HAD superfamily hydrolase (TIGR01549 family)